MGDGAGSASSLSGDGARLVGDGVDESLLFEFVELEELDKRVLLLGQE